MHARPSRKEIAEVLMKNSPNKFPALRNPSKRPGPSILMAQVAVFALAAAAALAPPAPRVGPVAMKATSSCTSRACLPAMNMRDGHEVLGVQPDASLAEVKAAYHKRVKRCHPDHNPSKAAAQEFLDLTAVSACPARLPCSARPPEPTCPCPPWSRRSRG